MAIILQQLNKQQMGQSAGVRQIYITIESGQTQSQQLFDFNSSENRIVTNQLIKTNTFIAHDGENVTYQPQDSPYTPIYTVKIDQQCLQLQSLPHNNKSLWRVLGEGQLYPLEAGSLIKIGKVKLKFKEIIEEEKEVTEKDFKSQSIYLQELAEVKSISAKSNVSAQNQCRICFDGSHTRQNPLVCLCKCSGSVKYIHFSCLKDWIDNKVERRQHNNTLFFSYQQTKCQICQQNYQPQFTYEGRKYILLNLDNAPNPPYAVFQEVDFDTENKRFSVYLIGLGDNQITIGRNSNSTVVMKQISVSRTHCIITYKNRTLYIKDKGSKFGTLVKVENEIEFHPGTGINLQYESKLIKIQQKSKLDCCCAQSDSFKLIVSHDPAHRLQNSLQL